MGVVGCGGDENERLDEGFAVGWMSREDETCKEEVCCICLIGMRWGSCDGMAADGYRVGGDVGYE